MSTVNSPCARKEKERISKAAHADCTKVLNSLLAHEALQKSTLAAVAKTGLLDGTFPKMDSVPIDLKTKLSKKSMGLLKVQQLLGSKQSRCRFKTCEKFAKDVRLVFQNVLSLQNYWKERQSSNYDAILYHTAQKLLQDFERMYYEQLAVHTDRPSTFSEHAPVAATPNETPFDLGRNSGGADHRMNEDDTQKCQLIVQKVMNFHEGKVSIAAPFYNPVDCNLYIDYKLKIPQRMHLFGVQQKLSTGAYQTIATFAKDMRLIFCNCLVYNSDVILSARIRDYAVKLLQYFEQMMQQTFPKDRNTWQGMEHTDRWKCHQILNDVLAHRTHGLETAQWFKYPIQTYFESEDQIPHDYFKKIKKPMDIGTVTSRLHLGELPDVASFVNNLRRVFENCIKYWKGNTEGLVYYESAEKLLALVETRVMACFGSNLREQSHESASIVSKMSNREQPSSLTSSGDTIMNTPSKQKAALSAALSNTLKVGDGKNTNFPEKTQCLAILQLIRKHKMKGVMGEIFTAGPFLQAVDITKYPDYLEIVQEPMDFAKIERKLKSNRYSSISEFSADVHLIFSNCMKYNSDPLEGADIRTMANILKEYFDAFYKKLESGRDISVTSAAASTVVTSANTPARPRKVPPTSADQVKSSPSGYMAVTDLSEKKKKKEKKEKKKKKDKRKDKKHKKDDTPVPSLGNVSLTALTSAEVSIIEKNPIALATVAAAAAAAPCQSKNKKPGKPSKSKVKLELSQWETDCERILSRLIKLESVHVMHFDVPLLEIFPDLAPSYNRLVPEPMDLGTMRNMLTSHSIANAAEFVRLGLLVFSNAEKFNIGPDASSMRVREMAAHLRWFFESMCLEYRLNDDAKLRLEWKNDRFDIVQSLRFTEDKPNKECLKVLRVLYSQKYQKHCWPFLKPVRELFPNLATNYYEIITNPMDLQTVSDNLNCLKYKTYGEFIADVRLTFENALLYNIADKEKDGPNVYSSAEKMLSVAMDQWGDVTIDIVERVKRGVLIQKEAQKLAQENRATEAATLAADEAEKLKLHQAKLEQQKIDEEEEEGRARLEREAQAASAKAAKEAKLVLLPNEKLSKSERKLEEKRKKKAKKDEEAARTERRRKTATMATEEALREAERRSRLRQMALGLVEENRLKQEELKLAQSQTTQSDHQKRKAIKRKLVSAIIGPFWRVKKRPTKVAECFTTE